MQLFVVGIVVVVVVAAAVAASVPLVAGLGYEIQMRCLFSVGTWPSYLK